MELQSEEAAPPRVSPGTRYDERRQWVLPQGVVARQLATHPLFPRPKKNASGKSYAVSFDELAGNTALGMHMSRLQPGAHNQGHRHLDEALILVVSGRGWSELKQSDDNDVQRVEWQAGDLFAVPANAWHQHFNADSEQPSLSLAFKNTQLLRQLFGSRAFVYDNPFRLDDRYADEGDYWERRTQDADGVVVTNVLRNTLTELLADDPRAGRFVTSQRYRLGGHKTLEVALVEATRRGHVRTHKHVTEEAMYILAGRGRTILTADDGREVTFRWNTGDLICPPAGVSHQHVTEGHDPTRYLVVRNTFFDQAMQTAGDPLAPTIPDRFPDLIEPDYGDRQEDSAT